MSQGREAIMVKGQGEYLKVQFRAVKVIVEKP
jgi:hypothetical protein